jgi:hypothetical protein
MKYLSSCVIRWANNRIGKTVAGDLCEFLNEKYIDKNINEEWPASIDKEAHLKYHLKRVCE